MSPRQRRSFYLSLTTLHREYAALMGLPYFDLVDTILRPELPKSHAASADEVRQTMATYKLNEPQAKAILTSMNTDGFALIQGYAFPSSCVSIDHLNVAVALLVPVKPPRFAV